MTHTIKASDLRVVGHVNDTGWLKVHCPWHDDEKASGSWHVESGFLKCFGCAEVGMVTGGVVVKEANAGHETIDDAMARCTPAGTLTELWFAKRGVQRWVIEELGVRSVDYAGAVWPAFVYYSLSGDPVQISVRVEDGKKKSFPRLVAGVPGCLYNLPALVELKDDESVLVVEGEIDVLTCWQAGLRHVVGLPGAMAASPSLLAPLKRFQKILIGLDSDQAGDVGARKLATALGRDRCSRVVWA